VELFAPVYDAATHTATYEVEVLANWETSTELGFTQAPSDLAAVAPSFGAAHLFIDDCADSYIICENPSLWDFMEEEPGLRWMGFDGQGMCWNYGFCMPCEPYGHVQPDQCATYYHWRDRCNAEWNYCQPGTWLTNTYRVAGSCIPRNYSMFWGVGC
ncbi:MAG TPA: hypothetical protein VGT61_07390, partial [Thermomicrobiales bacterium]|nr:hypothetical protein [Thermomicrobiales bacterium]